MITPEQLESFIDILPKAVLYIVPGYITLTLYHASRDGKIQTSIVTLLKSMFFSYIYISIVNYLIGLGNISETSKDMVLGVGIFLLSVLVGAISNTVFTNRIINWIMIKFYNTTPRTNLIEDIRSLSQKDSAIYIIAILKEEGERYEGYLVLDRMDEHLERYIILDAYKKSSRLDVSSGKYEKIEDFTGDHRCLVVLDIDKISSLEAYIEKLQHKDNKFKRHIVDFIRVKD